MSSKVGAGASVKLRLSQFLVSHGYGRGIVEIVARNPCPTHGVPDDCKESIIGRDIHIVKSMNKGLVERLQRSLMTRNLLGSMLSFRMSHTNQLVVGFSSLFINNIMDTAATFYDVGHTSRALSVNSAATAPFIVGGTTGTATAFTDYALGDGTSNTNYKANGNYAQAATSITNSTNTTTWTAVITNGSGSNITYKEVGTAVTVSTYQFLITHDLVNSGTGYAVSPSGTLTVNYTGTWT